MNDEEIDRTRIYLWDVPLRIFHWSLVLAVIIAIVTAKIGGDWMELHGKAGLAIIGLLAFRITWGVFGSDHARFAHFAPTPGSVLCYIKGQWQGVGHNPLGAISVFALLGLLAAQAVTGLFCNDDIAFNGPLSGLIDKDFSDRLTSVHHQLSNILLGFIIVHIAAVFFYLLIKKDNLIKPMVTGWKDTEAKTLPPSNRARGSFMGLISSILIGLLAVYAANASGWTNIAKSAFIDKTAVNVPPVTTASQPTSSAASETTEATKPVRAW